MEEIFEWSSIKKHVEINVEPVQQIPAASMKGFHLDLWKLSFYENAKYGETGRFPATHAFKAHFGSFLDKGFESHRECLEVKFCLNTEECEASMYTVGDFSVGYVDGQNKAMIMLSIMALLSDLDPWNTISMKTVNMERMTIQSSQVMVLNKVSRELILIVVQWSVSTKGVNEDDIMEEEALSKAIASFRFVKCNYGRHETPEGFLYETLCHGLGIKYHYTKIQETSNFVNHWPCAGSLPLPMLFSQASQTELLRRPGLQPWICCYCSRRRFGSNNLAQLQRRGPSETSCLHRLQTTTSQWEITVHLAWYCLVLCLFKVFYLWNLSWSQVPSPE